MSDVAETDDSGRSENSSLDRTGFEQLRPEDHAVLEAIRQGDDTLRAINKRTVDGFDQDNINYAFRKLERFDLIMVQRREGWTTSILENGEPRTHRKSKKAALTERGMAYFDWKSREVDLGLYAAEPSNDQAKTVQDLRADIDDLQSRIADLRADLDDMQSQVAQLEAQRAKQGKRISKLQTGLTTLQQEVQQIKQVLRRYVPSIPDHIPLFGSSDDD